jgi:hypothetical protein
VTIRKGGEWGERVARPTALVVVAGDADLADVVCAGATEPLAVASGDLLRTLGGGAAGATARDGPGGPEVQRVPLDLLRVEADGVERCAVAHVVARRSWWRGPIVGVFNAEYLGRWDVAPRSHPNDGRADVVVVDAGMSRRARFQAWRRLPAGVHVPHPAITVSQRPAGEWEFPEPLTLHLDGRRQGPVRHLAFRVEPDAFDLHV